MGVKVTGMIETELMLAEVGTTAKRRVTSKLYDKALEIAELAKKMAPLDDANLEKAIKVFPEQKPGRTRNALGQFVRTEIFVYVDTSMPVPGRAGKTVGDYAYTMHEHLTPFGPYKLGPLSQEKQSGQRELVGGKYLERAMNQLADSVLAEVSEGVLLRFDT